MSTDNLHALRQAVENGLVTEVQEAGLCLFKYTRNCMFKSKNWGSTTKKARGIILSIDGDIICRPFDKFFNYEEVPATTAKVIKHKLSKQTIEIEEKLDGSLIALWHHNGEWHTSTTGSFHSAQAEYALAMLNTRYPLYPTLHTGYTYLFELVGAEWDRKVVKYDEEALVLLTAFQNVWEEKEIGPVTLSTMTEEIGFRRPKIFSIDPNEALAGEHIEKNEEGYVIRFNDGQRIKIKSMLYVRLHRLLGKLTPKRLVEVMSGESYNELMWEVPEHIKVDFDDLCASLRQMRQQVLFEEDEYWRGMQANVEQTEKVLLDYKNIALYIKKNTPQEYHSLLFCKMRRKDRDKAIWAIVLERAKKIL